MTAIVGKPGAKSGIVAFSQGARGIGYEEGTWTPGFGTSVTHGASTGCYRHFRSICKSWSLSSCKF